MADPTEEDVGDPPKPIEKVWPWQADLNKWMNKNNRANFKNVTRKQYIPGPHVLFDEVSWKSTVMKYRAPYRPRAEMMVQMLVTVLAQERTRHITGDDPDLFAAALRWQKRESAFEHMADLFEMYIEQLDLNPKLQDFAVILGLIKKPTELIPGEPVEIRHMSRKRLGLELMNLKLTLDSPEKLEIEEERIRKRSMDMVSRWTVLRDFLIHDQKAKASKVDDLVCTAAEAKIRNSIMGLGEGDVSVLDALNEEPEMDPQNSEDEKKEEDKEGGDSEAEVKHAQKDKDIKETASEEKDNTDVVKQEEEEEMSPKKLLKIRGSRLSLMTQEERDLFEEKKGESISSRFAKISLLEEEIQKLCRSSMELHKLWNDVDNNGNGDLGFTEWMQFVKNRFQVVSHERPARRAFMESATKDSTKPHKYLTKQNFEQFLSRMLQYTKLFTAFHYLDVDGNDQVDLKEYRNGGTKFRKLMGLREDTSLDAHFKEIAREDTQTISFLSLCEWYKEKYLDAYIENGFGGSNAYNQAGHLNEMFCDVNAFEDLVIHCHYISRMSSSAAS
eukprot:m.114737 g.114737  ORF g.114737 m.114737 type:complete len:557 (-) comp14177_c1_seq5:6224-7894(-)